jgi:hypothetical protein
LEAPLCSNYQLREAKAKEMNHDSCPHR